MKLNISFVCGTNVSNCAKSRSNHSFIACQRQSKARRD
ncbi:hypothetical protein PVAG01_00479 [Phlyctema vagabunda]|uniref:Uncharacterized protein n=1 Tax=Phlyctema vagabunda TaxID=108571 RepID=A0ABR4PUC8_9HELO